MMVEEFQIGDPVWAKMKGYPPWPAKIVRPPSKAQKNKHFVYFFGSNNNAWIPDEHIIPHNEQQFLNLVGKKKNSTLQNAINELVRYSKSYKRRNASSFKVKSGKNENKKPRTKIVKVKNNVPKKHERRVSDNKSHIKRKKVSSRNLNGSSTYPFSTSSDLKDVKTDISVVPRHMSLFLDRSAIDIHARNPKDIQPSHLRFGFIGLGVLGSKIVKTLMQSGHDITVWNRTSQHCDTFLIMGAKRASSAADLIINCDVTFCCVSDQDATRSIFYNEQGILKGLIEASKLGKGRRGFVNMTNTDPDFSIGLGRAITQDHGFYLEAPVCGSSLDAANGKLLVLAAGDRILFKDCETCFRAIGSNAYYISCDAGEANKMNLVMSMLSGTVCVAVAEALVLIERLKLQKEDFLMCLADRAECAPNMYEQAKRMTKLSFKTVTALKYVQKDFDLCLAMADTLSQPLPVAAAANETYKYAKMKKISQEDVTAVYKIVKF